MPKKVEDRAVFQATIRMVSERGFAGATTKQIAEAAAISEVTLFRKYGNKSSLLKKAIRFTVETYDFESASRYTGDIREDLIRFVTCYQELANSCGQFFPNVFVEMTRYPELADVEDVLADVFGKLEGLMKHYKRKGLIEPEPPRYAAMALLGPMIMTNMMRYFTNTFSGTPLDLDDHVERFLHGWGSD